MGYKNTSAAALVKCIPACGGPAANLLPVDQNQALRNT
jgi:hypothetical protein